MPKFSITSFNLQQALPSNFQSVLAVVSNDPNNPGAITRGWMGAVNMPAAYLGQSIEIGSGSPSTTPTPKFYLEVATAKGAFALYWESSGGGTYSVKSYRWQDGSVATLWQSQPGQVLTYAQNLSLTVDNSGSLSIAPA